MKKFTIALVLLTVVGIALSLIYFLNSDINPKVISYDHTAVTVLQEKGRIAGEFTAQNNYLGILTVRFANKDIIENKSLFRIKERGTSEWYHSASIDAVQYNIKPLYTFGLPIIADSMGKTYEFEILLPDYVQGGPNLSLSTVQPVLISQYVFPTKILIKNRDVLSNFLKQKLSYQMQTRYASSVFFSYNLPLFAFVIYIFFLRMKFPISFRLNPISVLTLLGVALDICVLRNHYFLFATALSIFWIAGIVRYKIKPETSILIALILLIWCPFFLVSHMEWVAEKSANWMFILVSIGFFQYFFDNSFRREK